MTAKPKFGLEPNVADLIIKATELLNDEKFPFAESGSEPIQEVEIKGNTYELILTLKFKSNAHPVNIDI